MALARRAALIALVAGLLLAVLATPAFAHGRGSDATNFSSRIRSAPDVPGVSWQIYGGDELLGLTNTSDREVLVLGYEDEPYLRVGPDGVFLNRNSLATYQNADRYGRVEVPPEVDPDAEPVWDRVGDGNRYLFHDHRIHYMAFVLPPAIAAAPGEPHEVLEWTVPFQVDGGPQQEVTGDLRWVPGAPPWPWLLGALVVTLPALAGLRTSPTADDRWPGLARPAALVLGVLAALNVFHLVDDLFAVPLPWPAILLSAGQTAMFILIAVLGAVRGWQARDGAFTAIGVGAAALFIGQGLLYLSVLMTSQNASLVPELFSRAVVAASIVAILPLGAVAVIGTRRLLPDYDEAEDAEAVATPTPDSATTTP
jgi:hypothetical protein